MERDAKIRIILLIVLTLLISCAPYVNYQSIASPKSPKSPDYNISVYHELDPLPPHVEKMGHIVIDNSVPSITGCDYDDIINLAKWKVRKVGGDALHITNIKLPDEVNSCYGIDADIISFDIIEDLFWPSIDLNKEGFKKYYRENILDPIEGIWTVSENTNWYNILSSIKGNNEIAGKYEIAIIRDENDYNRYNSFILNSKEIELSRGMMKAYYIKNGFQNSYEEHWFRADHSEIIRNIILDKSGFFKTETSFSKYPLNYERETISLKVYPRFYMTSSDLMSNSQFQNMGSGFVISGNGLVITNYHIIHGKEKIDVYFPSLKKTFSAKIVVKDKNNDIALLALEKFHISDYFTEDIPFIISNTNDMRLGQEIFTLGYPLGEFLGNSVKLSTGDVSSLYGIKDDPRLIQISNPIQPGNSGGPLLNEKGEIVGVVLSTLNAQYFYENNSVIPQNINFAIKSDYVSNLISILPEYKELTNRKNLLLGKSFEEKIELISPFIVTIK
tara:strand:+ start:238 stop:1743 length:1506 start_codon:yes stop_codon:yes gene_type:complete